MFAITLSCEHLWAPPREKPRSHWVSRPWEGQPRGSANAVLNLEPSLLALPLLLSQCDRELIFKPLWAIVSIYLKQASWIRWRPWSSPDLKISKSLFFYLKVFPWKVRTKSWFSSRSKPYEWLGCLSFFSKYSLPVTVVRPSLNVGWGGNQPCNMLRECSNAVPFRVLTAITW